MGARQQSRASTAPTIVPVAWTTRPARCWRTIPTASTSATAWPSWPATGRPHSVTADRARVHRPARHQSNCPHAVVSGAGLSGRVEAGDDPCAAIARDIEIPAGGDVTLLWLLGDAGSAAGGERAGRRQHRGKDFDERLADNERELARLPRHASRSRRRTRRSTPWSTTGCPIRAWPAASARARPSIRRAAPSASATSCRTRWRCCCTIRSWRATQILNAAAPAVPGRRRAALVAAAHRRRRAHHDLRRRGLAGLRRRTTTSQVTGDAAILDEQAALHRGPAAAARASTTPSSRRRSRKTTATLYEHCARALDLAIKRTSASGLPLILGGDWNDGMNRVGEERQGRKRLARLVPAEDAAAISPPIAKAQGDAKRARAPGRSTPTALKRALESAAWDGEWYRRGSFDDGTPLGSHNSDECKIDSIAQSWSVLSGEGDPARSRTAMQPASEHAGRRRAQDHQAVHAALLEDARRTRATSRAIRRACARMAASTPMRRPGSSSRWPKWAGPTRPIAASRCSTRSTMRSTRRRPNATASSPMWSPPTSIRRATRAGAAAGPGTPARPAGSTAPRSKAFSASSRRGKQIIVEPGTAQPLGRLFRNAADAWRPQSTASTVVRDEGRPRRRHGRIEGRRKTEGRRHSSLQGQGDDRGASSCIPAHNASDRATLIQNVAALVAAMILPQRLTFHLSSQTVR